MPRNGTGTYSLPAGNPVVTGTTISSTVHNNTMSDIGTELTNSIDKGGRTTPTANLPMGTYRHTGVGNASARTDYASAGQVQDGAFSWCGTAGGTANALTLTPSPAITAYAAGQVFLFKTGAAANTSTVTIAVSGLSTIAAQFNGAACAGGELQANLWYVILVDAGLTTCQISKFGFEIPAQAGNANRYLSTNGTTLNWAASPALVPRSARTSNTILAAADAGYLIDYTSGTFTQTFTAAPTLGSGWYAYLRNAGTGDITIPSSDGVTNWIMYPGECRLFQCDGTNFNSIVITPFSRVFTSTETFTRPPGYGYFGGLLWAGGGAGGKGGAGFQTAGGGGGACVPFTFTAAQIGTSQTITIAAGGTATAVNGDGGAGGNSTIGSLVTAYGGGGGGGNAAADRAGGGGGGALSAGATGTASGGLGGHPAQVAAVANLGSNQGFGGAQGGQATANNNNSAWGGAGGSGNAAVTGGNSVYGGAGGGGVSSGDALIAAGTSVFGGNGGAAGVAVDGTVGSVPAGGGGATHTGSTSGAGGAGKCIIWGIV